MNRQFFMMMMMTALLAVVFTSCKKGEEGEKDETPPAWFTDAKTNFKNGRFVPEIEDILPGSMFGTITSSSAGVSSVQSSSAKSSGISAKSIEGCETLPFSEIKDLRSSLIRDVSLNQESILKTKSVILETFEGFKLTEQNVWVSDGKCRVKYTEDANGKYVYWTRDESEWGRFVNAKLSMNSDGANEIYFFETDKDGNLTSRSCTYLKGDKYIFVSTGPTEDDGTCYLMSFDTKNGKKKGKYTSFSKNDPNSIHKQYSILDFEGDDADFVTHSIYDVKVINDGTTFYLHQQASSIINGVICPYNGNQLDIKAFSNIAEIYTKQEYEYFSLRGIKLTDGFVIDDIPPSMFSVVKIDPYKDGVWHPWKPGDDLSCVLLLDAKRHSEDEEKETLSDCIMEPSCRSALQLSDGFEELYAKLKKASVGYFDNYYITEFSPIASIKVSAANIEAIANAISAYVQSQHEGF